MMGPTVSSGRVEMQFGVHLPQIGVVWPGEEALSVLERFAREVMGAFA